jgi:stage V sporulation protein SpoVS
LEKVKKIKISAQSDPSSIASFIIGTLKRDDQAELKAIDTGALSQAVRAVAIARNNKLAPGTDLVCIPKFVKVDGKTQAIIKLIVKKVLRDRQVSLG